MPRVHKFVRGEDYRRRGQTEHEYAHTTTCGYVRDNVTTDDEEVTCYFCKNKELQDA